MTAQVLAFPISEKARREKALATRRAYYAANRETILAKKRAKYAENPEQVLGTQRERRRMRNIENMTVWLASDECAKTFAEIDQTLRGLRPRLVVNTLQNEDAK
jgi:hypothetical protein